jgi:hypothetical protein
VTRFLVEVCVARKDLSRTVIEGGRRFSNSYVRRASHGEHRATTRAWLDQLRFVDDVDDVADGPPPLRHVGKQFHDKLGPAERWLRSQIGRLWDDVYADLCALFDTRTTAGRHIVHDHMLPSVRRWDVPTSRYWSRDELVIDEEGILRAAPFANVSRKKLHARASALAQGRVAANTYRGWLWFDRLPVGPTCLEVHRCKRRHYLDDKRGHYHRMGFVAVAVLTRGELGALFSLPWWLRDPIVIDSPL